MWLVSCALILLSGCGQGSKPHGVEVVLEINQLGLTAKQQADIEGLHLQVIEALRRRSMQLSQEPRATWTGGQITVSLPGATDVEQAAKLLTSRRNVAFYNARTVTPGTGKSRLYEINEQVSHSGAPAFVFRRTSTGVRILPGTAEYRKMLASWGSPIVSTNDIGLITAQPEGGSFIPSISFALSGAEKLEMWTRGGSGKQLQLACVIDGQVVSIAHVAVGVILSDKALIYGTFDKDYVPRLKDMVGAGSLPVDLLLKSKRKF